MFQYSNHRSFGLFAFFNHFRCIFPISTIIQRFFYLSASQRERSSDFVPKMKECRLRCQACLSQNLQTGSCIILAIYYPLKILHLYKVSFYCSSRLWYIFLDLLSFVTITEAFYRPNQLKAYFQTWSYVLCKINYWKLFLDLCKCQKDIALHF